MVNMPIPTPSPYSDDSEGSVLRDFVNESIIQDQSSPSPRSELLSQPSHGGHTGAVEQSKRSRRSSHGRHRQNDGLVHADASQNELIRRLNDQTQETHTLRRALRIAAVQMDSEVVRALELERTQSQTAEHFRILTESRRAAQQEAMKATQELRLYQFQLQNAQDEIARAQEVLKAVEDQRDDAEQAAARARATARQLQQERVVAAAREEGRRYGFEAGLKRAKEERERAEQQNGTHSRGRGSARQKNGAALVQAEIDAPVQDVEGTFDQMSNISSPSHLPLRNLDNLDNLDSPQVIRVPRQIRQVSEPAAISPSPPRDQTPPQAQYRSPSPPEPVPIVHPAPDIQRSVSPSIQVFEVDIPPAAEIEQQYNPNEYSAQQPQHQWVTAQQHLEMSDQQPFPQNPFQSNAGHMDIQRNASITSWHARPNGGSTGRKKESWYRTLSRRLGRKSKREQPNNAVYAPPEPEPEPAPPQPASWYTPKPAPPIRIRDFGVPKLQSSRDSGSVSTRMSQLDLVSPPNKTPNGSERSFRPGGNPGRMFKNKSGGLFVINEDPGSRSATPAKGDSHQRAQSMEQMDPSFPSQNSIGKQRADEPRYSNPSAVDEWRRSASTPREANPHVRLPNGLRRPVKLTVPAPLSLDNPRSTPRSRTRSDVTQNSNFSRNQEPIKYSARGLTRQTTSPGPSPIGINVEPPSRSPSDTLGSSGLQNNYLSPNQSRRSLPPSSLRSAPIVPSSPSSPAPNYNTLSLEPNGRTSPFSSSGPPPRKEYPPSPQPSVKPLHPHKSPSHPASTSGSTYTQTQPYPTAHSPQPPAADYTSAQEWWGNDAGSDRYSAARGATPGPSNQHLPPAQWGSETGSQSSRRRATGGQTPGKSKQALPPAAAAGGYQWAGQARSDGSQKSAQHLTPGPEQTLHRVPSDFSMRSGGSYAHYDPSKYLDPSTYFAEAGQVATPHEVKTHGRAASASSTLSYVSDVPRR